MQPKEEISVSVLPCSREHLEPLAEALLRVRVADPTYPPPRDVDASKDAFTSWLLSEETIGRWVAIVDGFPAGHISLTRPHSYLVKALEDVEIRSTSGSGFCEISKFFTDPLYQRLGVGAALFEEALNCARSLGFQPTLAVVDTSYDARRFYAARGLVQVGSFRGIHGTNYLFVDAD